MAAISELDGPTETGVLSRADLSWRLKFYTSDEGGAGLGTRPGPASPCLLWRHKSDMLQQKTGCVYKCELLKQQVSLLHSGNIQTLYYCRRNTAILIKK